jgi:hypothetical protein
MVSTLGERGLADFVAAIQTEGTHAAYWAEYCGWVPGTEFCPGVSAKACREQCFFHAWRDRRSKVIRLARQRRRRPQMAGR